MNINPPRNFSDPIFPQLSDIKPVKIIREGNIVSIDFIYSKVYATPVSIPGKGDMNFRVVAEYIGNQYWAISDYEYNYNINDYLQYILNK